jgi:hypothetical protein
MLRALNRMLYGPLPLAPVPAERWPAAIPVVVALILLVLGGVAWPPGVAAALELIVSLVAPRG